jgi:predicted MFS family arabinose efflux permease
MSNAAATPSHHTHPALFALLLYPFGVASGYLTTAIAYDLRANGVGVAAIAIMISWTFVPNTWKFLWAPFVDLTLSPKVWFVGATVITALGVFAMDLVPPVPDFLVTMTVVATVASLASTFAGAGAEAISVRLAPDDEKGRYGGWMQVGNFIGGGVGGGLGLYLSQHLEQRWISGAVVGGSCLLCPLALLAMPAVSREITSEAPLTRVVKVLGELWDIVRSSKGALAILVLFLPLGTGAASGLWSSIAGDWHASADAVALSNGAWSGVISGVGCLVGGYIADKMDRKWSYAVFGLVQAACAVAMATAPRTEVMFIVFTLMYAFTSGLTYASFSAIALEAAGMTAAATSYSLFAALSNFPIQYMTVADGFAHERFGAGGMLYIESAICVAAVVIYTIIKRLAQPKVALAA